MNTKKFIPTLLVLFLICLCVPALRADTLNASLVESTLTGTAGSSVTFQANILNPSVTDTFLNSDKSITSSLLATVDDTPFLFNAPTFLSSGTSFGPFDIFTVLLDPSIAPGIYTGTFSILGGGDGAALTDLADLNFTVDVTVVPEPSILYLLLVTISLAGVLSVRKLRWR